jgi:hypothetical protein
MLGMQLEVAEQSLLRPTITTKQLHSECSMRADAMYIVYI